MPEDRRFLGGLDAFGDGLKIEAARQADEMTQEDLVLGALRQIAHERAVDLDDVDGQGLKMAQRGEARTEIVERDAAAEIAQGADEAHRFLDVVQGLGLGDLDQEAARDLGATPWQSFRLVTLPLIMPAVTAGALMSFTLSIDDFVITFFTAGVGVSTLPLQIFTMIKVAVTPEVNAVSTLLMLVTLTLIVLASRVAPDALKGRT